LLSVLVYVLSSKGGNPDLLTYVLATVDKRPDVTNDLLVSGSVQYLFFDKSRIAGFLNANQQDKVVVK